MVYNPRLNSNGMSNNLHWYSNGNPYYATGYGMPNCTAYAWGRFWEVGDPTNTGANKPDPYDLPGYWDAGLWWTKVDRTVYQTGNVPQLGAFICFSNNGGGAGHVAIVEVINNNGTIITSNSAYGGTYFYTQTLSVSNNYAWGNYTFQGFIYNPHSDDPTPPIPPIPTVIQTGKFPWGIYLHRYRTRDRR